MRRHHAEKSIERWVVCDLHIIIPIQPGTSSQQPASQPRPESVSPAAESVSEGGQMSKRESLRFMRGLCFVLCFAFCCLCLSLSVMFVRV